MSLGFCNFNNSQRFGCLMNPSNDNYVPRAAPAIQGYVCGSYPVSELGCQLVFENADAYVFARAFYTRWGWHSVNTRLVKKLRKRVKEKYELDFLRDIDVLNSRGWIITNPYKNTTRLSSYAVVKVIRDEPLYTPVFLD